MFRTFLAIVTTTSSMWSMSEIFAMTRPKPAA